MCVCMCDVHSVVKPHRIGSHILYSRTTQTYYFHMYRLHELWKIGRILHELVECCCCRKLSTIIFVTNWIIQRHVAGKLNNPISVGAGEWRFGTNQEWSWRSHKSSLCWWNRVCAWLLMGNARSAYYISKAFVNSTWTRLPILKLVHWHANRRICAHSFNTRNGRHHHGNIKVECGNSNAKAKKTFSSTIRYFPQWSALSSLISISRSCRDLKNFFYFKSFVPHSKICTFNFVCVNLVEMFL